VYHAESRSLQDRFDTRRLADRIAEKLVRTAFTDDDIAFVTGQAMFFLATADADGWPDCSYKAGLPGFVKVLDRQSLAFPSYDGNGMFKSLGNLMANPRVGLLFIDFEQPRRLRVQGRASLRHDDPLRAEFPGALCVVRVHAERIFPNCPRYIHRMRRLDLSPNVPSADHEPPAAEWKRFEMFRDVLPKGDPAALPDEP
jgi:hypothetical protein